MYQQIKTWMHRNARELELNLWSCLFEGGSKEAVVTALMEYQNADGGFGHALEADNWNPNSTPYTTSVAINLLQSIEFIDLEHPIYQGIMKYLESGEGFLEYGWCFSIVSNDDFAHAPWLSYSEEFNIVESVGLTAELVAFVIKYAEKNSILYQRAVKLVDSLLTKMMSEQELGVMGVGGYIVLLETLQQDKPKGYNYDLLQERLDFLVHDTLEKNAKDWSTYGMFPSDYIKSPKSIYYKQNKELVEKEIQYLIDTKPTDDVWGITWTWHDEKKQYETEFILSKNWWKAVKAIEKVRFLMNFKYLDEKIGGF